MGWKMLLTLMLVTFAVAVGATFDKVAVLTSESVEVALTNEVGKGLTEGLPEVSKLVCTMPVVLVITAEVAVWTADVVSEVKDESGRLVVTAAGAATEAGASVGVDAP